MIRALLELLGLGQEREVFRSVVVSPCWVRMSCREQRENWSGRWVCWEVPLCAQELRGQYFYLPLPTGRAGNAGALLGGSLL